ncbi:MAG: methyltransferase FkbM family [Solirubrobacterales bacterium]|nr:methyltransferase FkbM family [Solirubrobacterales bacterium]
MRPLDVWSLVVRAVDRMPGLRQLHWQPSLRRWWLPLRTAPYVAPSWRFAGRELLRRKGTHRYRLRRNGLHAWLRQPLNDMWIVDEIFVQGVYEPPVEVLARVGDAPRVLDVGGHAGLFALFALGRWPAATVMSLEPNPGNAAVLDRSLRTGGLERRWTLRREAAGVAPGRARVGGPSFLSRLGEEGTEVAVVDALTMLDHVDLAKIDVEGAERALLEDPRLADAGVCALVLELHEAAPGETAYRQEAVSRLEAAGFVCGPLFDERPDTACVWAWRPGA